MNEFRPLLTTEDWSEALVASQKHPIIVFKYSSTCPTSRDAESELEDFMGEYDVPVYKIVVQDSHELSQDIADELDVEHETPQVVVVQSGMAVFDASHYEVTKDLLEEVFKKE
jgi:bacillithiol system protein YtxJ